MSNQLSGRGQGKVTYHSHHDRDISASPNGIFTTYLALDQQLVIRDRNEVAHNRCYGSFPGPVAYAGQKTAVCK